MTDQHKANGSTAPDPWVLGQQILQAIQSIEDLIEAARADPAANQKLIDRKAIVYEIAERHEHEPSRQWLRENGFQVPRRPTREEKLRRGRLIWETSQRDRETLECLVVIYQAAKTEDDARKWLQNHGLPAPRKRAKRKKSFGADAT